MSVTTIQAVSAITGETHTRDIPIDPKEYINWVNAGDDRPHIQDAFPNLSAQDREFMLSGTTAEEWNELFGEGEAE